jgi:Tol biopolymer transport system component
MSRYIIAATLVAAAAFAAWQTPTNLGPTVNTAAGEWWPFVSVDGRYIVFVSDRAGGYGGVDIWRTDYSGGAWQAPVNMGANVNTTSGEYVPYLSYNESRLYFISACPGGQGNYDIWYCPISGGTAGPKVNMGPNVNTADLDC